MIASVDRLFTAPVQHDPLGVRRKGGMSESNGVGLGQVLAMLTDIMLAQQELRRELRHEVGALRQEMGALRQEIGALRQEMGVLRHDLDVMRHDVDVLRQDMAALRQEVATYHGSVVGHGVLITELDQRVSRIEQHLDQPAPQ